MSYRLCKINVDIRDLGFNTCTLCRSREIHDITLVISLPYLLARNFGKRGEKKK